MANQTGRKMKAIIKDSYHCERLNLILQEYNTKEKYTDLCFICKGGIQVKAHKLVICSVSAKLKQIFLDLPEVFKFQEIHVSVPDIEARVLRLVFDFLYEGQVKLDESDSPSFHAVMTELDFPLSQKDNTVVGGSQLPSQAAAQPPQVVYLQGPPSNQGQVQYLMASPGSLNSGQLVQGPLMTPMVQGGIAQPSQQPMIMTQANGQLVQTGGQVLTNQVQQMQVVQQNNSQMLAMNNQMQVVQQNVAPVVSMNNQMMTAAGNQMVAATGNQLVQCSSQAVVQGNRPLMMNNNQMQYGLQNQNYHVNQNVQQPQPQVQQQVRAGSNNVMTPARQYNRTQTNAQNQRTHAIARNRPSAQPQATSRVNNTIVRTRKMINRPMVMSQNRTSGGLVGSATRMVQRGRPVQ